MGLRVIKRAILGPFMRWKAARQTAFAHDLVFGAIFKDEARYLNEWLSFHHGVGVEKFHLYNNNSSDNYLQVLAPWIERGIVTLTEWPARPGQMSAYADCVQRHATSTRWMALIDIDEFLFSPETRDLRQLMNRFASVPGVFAYWVLFGSGGHEKRPAGSVIDAYKMRLDLETAQSETHPKGVTGKSKQGKTIFNPRLVMRVDHCCPIMWSGQVVDEKFSAPPRHSKSPQISWNVLRINHYWSRSIEDVYEKVGRGQAKNGKNRDLENFLSRERSLNKEHDIAIQPLWNEIRLEPEVK